MRRDQTTLKSQSYHTVLDQMGCCSYQKHISHVLRDKVLYFWLIWATVYVCTFHVDKGGEVSWLSPTIFHYKWNLQPFLGCVIAHHLFRGFERADRKLPPLRGKQYLILARKIGCRWIWKDPICGASTQVNNPSLMFWVTYFCVFCASQQWQILSVAQHWGILSIFSRD